MDALRVLSGSSMDEPELVAFEDIEAIPETDEYDAFNDETFGNVDAGDDWEEGHEQFVLIEERFKKISCNDIGTESEKPKLKTLEEIEREMVFNNQAAQNNMHMFPNPPQRIKNDFFLFTNHDVAARDEEIIPPHPQALSQLELLMMQPRPLTDTVNIVPHHSIFPQPPKILPSASFVDLDNAASKLLPVTYLHSKNFPPELLTVPLVRSEIPPPITILQKNCVPIPLIQNESLPGMMQSEGLSSMPPEQCMNVSLAQAAAAEPPQDLELDVESEDVDPYAGLMTSRERRWLANIQVMQLEGDDPDYDYYFTEYQKRHGLQHRNSNDKFNVYHNSNESPKMSYIPLQFENSLGKVQVGSVVAPRKVIDRDLVAKGTSQNLKTKPRKKLKHVLLELEHMFTAIQKLEPRSSSETPSGIKILQRKAAPPPLELGETSEKSKSNELPADPNQLMTFFLRDRDHFQAYMTIRKGKVLAYRLLRRYPDNRFWIKFFEDFQLLVSRDARDEILLTFLPLFRSWLMKCDWDMINFFISILGEPTCLNFAVKDKFGMSVIANIIVKAEHLFLRKVFIAPDQYASLANFIFDLVNEAANSKQSLVRPVIGIDLKTLESFFLRVERKLAKENKKLARNMKSNIVQTLALPTYQKKKKK